MLWQPFREAFTIDWRLAPYDLVSSKAHCRNLVKSKILTAAEGKKIESALDLLLKRYSERVGSTA